MDILRQPIPRVRSGGRTEAQPDSHKWKIEQMHHEEPVWAPPYHTRLIPR